MFERIKDALKKPETITVKFEEMNEVDASSLLTSKINVNDGVFGFEWIKTQHKSERHLFLPQYKKVISGIPIFRTVLPRNINYKAFHAITTKPSCFPLKMEYDKFILKELDGYLKLNGEIVFAQMILQKHPEHWQNKYNRQYLDYLQGINPYFVTSNKLMRSIQQKTIEYVKSKDWITIDFDENPHIDGAERKFDEVGFSSCFRFVIYGDDDRINKLATHIELVLRDMDYANNWRLVRASNRSETLNQVIMRKYPIMQREQILCLSEVLPFLCQRTQKVEIETPVVLIATQERVETLPMRLSFKLPSLSHLPKGKAIDSEQDMTKHENHINKTLLRIQVIKDTERVKVLSVVEAATVRKVTFRLPHGIQFSSFNESVVKNIRSNIGKNAAIAMGNEPNTVALTVPLEKRGKVYLRDLIENEEFKRFAKDNPLPMLTGIDENGNVIMVCLSKLPHLLGAGTTGSGKSVWLNCVLLTLLLTKTPDEVAIFIIDPKLVEFTNYVSFPHVSKVETDPEKSVELLTSLTVEMDRRYAVFAKAGCKNIKQYNAKSTSHLKYIVCIIDEYSDLVMQAPDVRDYVLRLGQKARACGIHVIVATQRPDVNVIDGTIKAVLPARIAFKCASSIDYRTILDRAPKFDILGRGDGVCLGFDGVDGMVRFQGAMIADGDDETDKAIVAVLNEWKDIMKGVDVKQEEMIEVKQPLTPTDIEQAKFLICEEGKITQQSLAKLLKTRKENVKSIIDELVADDWLSEPTNNRSGYQVKISAQEIETFGIWYRETFGFE